MPIFDPNQALPDFATQTSEVTRQRALADALRKRVLDNQGPQGRMVSGHYVSPSWSEGLADLFNAYQSGTKDREATAAEQELSNAQNQAANQWRNSLPQAVAANAGQSATPFGVRDEPQQDAIQATPEVPVTRAQALKYTMEGLNNPKTKEAALLYNKSFGEDLNREDKQVEAKAARELQAQTSRDNKRDTLNMQLLQLQQQAQDRSLSREQQMAIARMMDDTKRYLGDLAHEDRVARASAASAVKELKPVPSSMAGAFNGNESSIAEIEAAIKAVEDNPKAFGLGRAGPNVLNEVLDPKGIEARAKVSKVGSVRRHDISGAAVTVAEDKKLVPWLPDVYNHPDSIKTKLRNLKNDLVSHNRSIEETATSQGYKPLRGDKSPGGLTPAEQKELDELKARFKK